MIERQLPLPPHTTKCHGAECNRPPRLIAVGIMHPDWFDAREYYVECPRCLTRTHRCATLDQACAAWGADHVEAVPVRDARVLKAVQGAKR